MGKYSINWEGKVLDFRWKKILPHVYAFYVGTLYVGQVFNLGRTWSGVGKHSHKLNGLPGFKTRMDVANFLLQLEGYYQDIK